MARINRCEQSDFTRYLNSNGYRLADERLITGAAEEAEVDVLIGANFIWKVVGSRQIVANNVCAIESKLGWLLLGQDQSVCQANEAKILALALGTSLAEKDTPEQLDHFLVNRDAAFDMKFFFECEQVKDLEQEAEMSDLWNRVRSSVQREPSGHYSVALPWIKGLPANQSCKSLGSVKDTMEKTQSESSSANSLCRGNEQTSRSWVREKSQLCVLRTLYVRTPSPRDQRGQNVNSSANRLQCVSYVCEELELEHAFGSGTQSQSEAV